METRSSGRFTIKVSFRNLGNDRGLSIQVFGPANGGHGQVLRFDCFDNDPHYHLLSLNGGDRILPIKAKDPYLWAISALASHADEFLVKADAEPLNESEHAHWSETITEIEQIGKEIAAEHRM